MSRIETKLAEMGLALPPVPKPVAAYIPVIRVGDLVMTSGQLPTIDGKLPRTGKVGPCSIPPTEAADLAKRACLNALAAVKSELGDLGRVERIVRVVVFVQSEDGFGGQPQVANGASELLVELFGDAGRHVRSAVGVNALPLDAPLELELTVLAPD